MKSSVCQSQIVSMKNLNNLFIEMTSKVCNQHCSHCYIEFPKYKKVEDFINIELVKIALDDTIGEDIKCIYLTGAEPMTHPDFNSILRLCLKRSDVCICTNGSFINEKKARFLKKVEDEGSNEIIFKISIDHFDEEKSDYIRCRGAFRQSVFAIKHLVKYGFMPIVVCTNYYNEDSSLLLEKFQEIFGKYSYFINSSHLQIIPWHDKTRVFNENIKSEYSRLDCEYGRVLTSQGIYTCPFLSDDYRGRCGSSFKDYTKRCSLETAFCQTCMSVNKQLFGINFSDFT